MNQLERYADQIGDILGRCDGGTGYPWRQAERDMAKVIREIRGFRPRTRGNQLIKRLLIKEAEYWDNHFWKTALINSDNAPPDDG